MSDPLPPSSPGSRPPELESWKDIAAYLRTSVRTVQRWEEQNGLPVHRVMREKRAAIYAHPHELDAWLAQRTVTPTPPAAPPPPESPPAAPIAPAPAAHRRSLWSAGLLLVGLLVAVALAFVRTSPPLQLTVQAHRLSSNPGFELHPVQSPNGAWFAYAWSHRGDNGITAQSTTTAESVVISQHPALAYSPQWSPDGNSLLFLRRKTDQISELLRYDWQHRTGPTVIAEVLGYNWYDAGVNGFPGIQWTPDGRAVLVRDRNPVTSAQRIQRLQLDSGQRLPVFEVPPGTPLFGFALSPDRAHLAVVIRSGGLNVLHTVPLDAQLRAAGPPVPVLPGEAPTESPAWSPNGDLFLIRAKKELWKRAGSAPPVQIPVVGEWPDYSVAVTPSGGLIWGNLRMDAAIWLYDLARQQPVKSLCDSTALDRMPRISPDGRQLLYLSERAGPLNLWICDMATQTPRQLTNLPRGIVTWGQWSPDGQFVAYTTEDKDQSGVHIVRRDGSPVATLASGTGNRQYPVWPPSGDRLYYREAAVGSVQVRSARVDGSDARVEAELPQLTAFAIRRDGRWWLLQAGKLSLADHPAAPPRVVAANVAELSGLAPDGLGIHVSQVTSAGLTSNYTLALVSSDGTPQPLAGATPEGMGFVVGPPGFALYTRNSDGNSDIFHGVPAAAPRP
jgi:Tol biopolymer transport system component